MPMLTKKLRAKPSKSPSCWSKLTTGYSRSSGRTSTIGSSWLRIVERPNMLLYDYPCTVACTTDFSISLLYHKFMKSDLRISIKDYRRNKNLKILLERAFSSHRQF